MPEVHCIPAVCATLLHALISKHATAHGDAAQKLNLNPAGVEDTHVISFQLQLILFRSGEGSPSNFTPQPYLLIPILHRHHGAAITSYSVQRGPSREVVRLRGAKGPSVPAANTGFLIHRQAVVVLGVSRRTRPLLHLHTSIELATPGTLHGAGGAGTTHRNGGEGGAA